MQENAQENHCNKQKLTNQSNKSSRSLNPSQVPITNYMDHNSNYYGLYIKQMLTTKQRMRKQLKSIILNLNKRKKKVPQVAPRDELALCQLVA